MEPHEQPPEQSTPEAPPSPPHRSAFWMSFWLAAILVGTKAAYIGLPRSFSFRDLSEYQRVLAITVHQDVIFAIAVGVVGQLMLWATARWRRLATAVWVALLLICADSAGYGVANLILLDYMGAPMTYAMMLIGG